MGVLGDGAAGIRAAGVVVVLTAVLAVIFLAFALPAARSKPHGVPIGIVGAQAVAAAVQQQLDTVSPGAFALTGYADQAALCDAYGGLVRPAAHPGGAPKIGRRGA